MKRRALLCMALSASGGLAFIISSVRGDWWMQIFSGSALIFNYTYVIYHYRKELKMKGELT